jgi:hypothetical protein
VAASDDVPRALLALAVSCLLAPAAALGASPYSAPGYAYVFPAPGTYYNSASTNVIIRQGGPIDPTSVMDGTTVQAAGEFSGDHPGRLRLSDDGRTILFRPSVRFFQGEWVTCRVRGVRTLQGVVAPDAVFQFSTGATGDKLLATDPLEPEVGTSSVDAGATDSLPTLTGTVYGIPAPGRLFLSGFRITDFAPPTDLLVARDNGMVVTSRRTPGTSYDYVLQPDGGRTYYDTVARAYYALDDSGAVVDSFRCGNGYVTDGHDLIVLPNGHTLLMAYDPERVDMSVLVPGGQPHAVVVGLVVQELDRMRDVVFQWRSWESVAVTEAMRLRLTAQAIDYIHGNSIDATPDGAVLVSGRNIDAVLKVSLETGDILWRLGGVKNQFAFVGDPERFTYQHDVRRIPNGHITLFDNGNGHSPPASRAAEYELDEAAMTATLVWEYRHVPSVFAFALGSVQRLSNGNTLIGWGATSPAATEVAPDGTVMSELWLPPGLVSYRVLRFEWPPALPVAVTPQPATYSPDSQGRWATIVIEPEEFDVARIDPTTVRLQGSLVPDAEAIMIGDSNGDQRPDVRIRFDMMALQGTLHPGANRIEIEGHLTGGGYFRGYALVTLLESMRRDAGPPPGGAEAAGSTRITMGAIVGGGAAGGAPLGIFDIQGRLVRLWRAAIDRDGTATWDGRGDDGRRLASGVYFVRELAPGRDGRARPARKIVLAR